MQQGQITVFLSLISTLLLSVICTAVEAVRVEGLILQGESAMQMAESSLLSSFQPDLLQEYELFFVNGANKNGQFSTERLENFLAEDLSYNLSVSKELSAGNRVSFFTSRVKSIELGDFCLATDAQGYEFYKQAILYEKNRLGVDLLESLVEETLQGENYMQEGENLSEEETEQKDTLKKLEEENKGTENEFSQEDFGEENPLKNMDDCKASGILALILGEKTVSGRQIDLTRMPSKRELLIGSGKKKTDSFAGAIEDRILFGEYILEKFHHALSEETGSGLSYEVEYILVGKNSDKENLEGVLNRLLLMREGINYLYLHSDNEKVAEAEALATALVGFTGLPPVVTAMRELLLLAWAYVESIVDLRDLMNGGTLALIKTSENWQTGLENIGNLLSEKGKKRTEKGGFTYEGYLRLLLGIKSGKEKVMAALDLIETNIRQKEDMEHFRIDCCFSKCNYKMVYEAKPAFLVIPISEGMLQKKGGTYSFLTEGCIAY